MARPARELSRNTPSPCELLHPDCAGLSAYYLTVAVADAARTVAAALPDPVGAEPVAGLAVAAVPVCASAGQDGLAGAPVASPVVWSAVGDGSSFAGASGFEGAAAPHGVAFECSSAPWAAKYSCPLFAWAAAWLWVGARFARGCAALPPVAPGASAVSGWSNGWAEWSAH